MKPLAFSVLGTVVVLGLLLALSEAFLRLAGVSPWRDAAGPDEPTVHQPDPVLGWTNREGSYVLGPYAPEGTEIHARFLANGRRATAPGPGTADGVTDGRPELILVGGSFTQGWAISDEETYAWKLQERLPALEVKNYGTGGYGTFQSQLTLERVLPEQEAPRIVVYGFIGHHTVRNVAPAHWMKALSSNSRRAHVNVPYVTVAADGKLLRHEPEPYLALPLRDRLATVAFAEHVAMWAREGVGDASRERQARAVTERLLLEMNETVAAHGAQLVVVDLGTTQPAKAAHYRDFLEASGIPAIDCNFELTREYKVPGDTHPNGAMNTRYADCIVEGLNTRVLLSGAVP